MEPLIKQHNFDLARYQKGTVDVLRSLSPKKEINMLAYNRPFFVMYYNKDIFDKFASTYPKDGMTWEDARELAKKVTRMDGGVQYRGLEPNVMNRTASQLNLPYIDEKTGKSAINTDKWKNYLQTMLSIYQIPGNEGYTVNAQAMDQFSKDRILAMLAINNALTKMATMNDMNWDMVSFPTFKEAPGIEPEFSGQTMSIPSTSKHKDAAMDVIMTVTSDEVLTEMSKDGYFVPFTDPKYQKSFATNLTGVQGKNLAAPFKTTPAVPVYHSPIWPKERNLVANSFAELEKSGMDVNTYLRTYEEKMNALINEANSK
jgi:multiple sugar transport system substrate-binding protein